MPTIHFAIGEIELESAKAYKHKTGEDTLTKVLYHKVAERVLENVREALASHGQLPDVIDVALDLEKDLIPRKL